LSESLGIPNRYDRNMYGNWANVVCEFFSGILTIKHHQTSSNIIKHHQTSSNIIKHHQTSSNIRMYINCELYPGSELGWLAGQNKVVMGPPSGF